MFCAKKTTQHNSAPHTPFKSTNRSASLYVQRSHTRSLSPSHSSPMTMTATAMSSQNNDVYVLMSLFWYDALSFSLTLLRLNCFLWLLSCFSIWAKVKIESNSYIDIDWFMSVKIHWITSTRTNVCTTIWVFFDLLTQSRLVGKSADKKKKISYDECNSRSFWCTTMRTVCSLLSKSIELFTKFYSFGSNTQIHAPNAIVTQKYHTFNHTFV